jgi:autotransporter-associated beta strand protein
LLLWNGSQWGGGIRLAADAIINCACDPPGATSVISGTITGPGGFTKIGSATLRLAGRTANTYSGVTRVHEGTLELYQEAPMLTSPLSPKAAPSGLIAVPGDVVIGDGTGLDTLLLRLPNQMAPGATVTLTASGLLDLNGYDQTIGRLIMTGGRINRPGFLFGLLTLGGDVTATSVQGGTYPIAEINAKVSLNNADRRFTVNDGPQLNDLTLSGPVSAGGITKLGQGNMVLMASNTYGGMTYVSSGTLTVANDYALGWAINGTVVSNGASVQVGGSGITSLITIREPLAVAGTGLWGGGAMVLWPQTTWSGYVTLSADTSINCPDSSAPATVSGVIQGTGSGVIKVGPGSLRLAGGTTNSFWGTTRVLEGTLLLAKSVPNVTIPGPLVVGTQQPNGAGATVRLEGNHQLRDTIPVLLNEKGWLDVGPFKDSAGSGTVSGLASGELGFGADNTSTDFYGLISGQLSVRKAAGSGTTTLWKDNAYTGYTYVDSGTLVINGKQAQSPATVSSGGQLAGRGSVGVLTVYGTVRPSGHPGEPTGTLTCGNLTFAGSGQLEIELIRPAASRYDQVDARGTVNLGGSALRLIPAFTSGVRVGDSFVILKNDASEPVSGTFAGLANGARFQVNNYTFSINYGGSDGNDVVLTVVGVPVAEAGVAVSGGNGNRAVDPNECNLFKMTITNETTTPMTGMCHAASPGRARWRRRHDGLRLPVLL